MRDAAVLIFADALGLELSRKGIASRHRGLFALPDLRGVDADVIVCGGAGGTFAERLASAVDKVRHYRTGRDRRPGLPGPRRRRRPTGR